MCNDGKIEKLQQRLLFGRQMFDVELTTDCNKKCHVCPREKLTRKRRVMATATFEFLCGWLPKDCDVFFAGLGEPLLHPDCDSFVHKLHQSGRRTSIMTNGSLISVEKLKRLFDNGLDNLQISIIQKTDFENLKKLVELIPSEFSDRVIINVIKQEKQSDQDVIGVICDSGFRYVEKSVHNRAGYLFEAENPYDLRTCATFFCDTFINADGEIHVCSNDINNLYKIGTIYSVDYESLVAYKTKFWGDMEICPLCSHCTDEYRMKHFKLKSNE